MDAARKFSTTRDVVLVALLAFIAWNTAVRGENVVSGVAGPESVQQPTQAAPAYAELQAAVTELRTAVRALPQATERTRVEPTPASAPQKESQDASILSGRPSGFSDAKALAGRLAPKQDAAIAALSARLQAVDGQKVVLRELWFSSLSRIVEKLGAPDRLGGGAGQISLSYLTENGSLDFVFVEGVLIDITGY